MISPPEIPNAERQSKESRTETDGRPRGDGEDGAATAARLHADEERAGGNQPRTRSLRVLAWPAERNASNPYTALLYRNIRQLGGDVTEFSLREALRLRHDVWHLHWPDHQLNRPSSLQACLRATALLQILTWARASGAKVVWTAHNLQSHESFHPRLERHFWRAFTRKLDGFISLTRSGATLARARFPRLGDLPCFVIPHGHYRGAYPNEISREEARERLCLPPRARVVCQVGAMRPYKNLEGLIESFVGLDDDDAVLLLAGRPSSASMENALLRLASADARIRIHTGFVPDHELQIYLRAADLAAFPFSQVNNSGSAILALSFDLPVLLPRAPTTIELQEQVGASWVKTFTGRLSSEALSEGLRWAAARPDDVCRALDALDWQTIAQQTLRAYVSL